MDIHSCKFLGGTLTIFVEKFSHSKAHPNKPLKYKTHHYSSNEEIRFIKSIEETTPFREWSSGPNVGGLFGPIRSSRALIKMDTKPLA